MIEDYFRPVDIDLSNFEEGTDSLLSASNVYTSKGKFPNLFFCIKKANNADRALYLQKLSYCSLVKMFPRAQVQYYGKKNYFPLSWYYYLTLFDYCINSQSVFLSRFSLSIVKVVALFAPVRQTLPNGTSSPKILRFFTEGCA